MSRTAIRSETELRMRAKAYEIEIPVIGLSVDEDRIGTNMAIAVVLPGTDQGMIVIAPWKNPVCGERGHDAREVRLESLRESALLLAFVVSLEGRGRLIVRK